MGIRQMMIQEHSTVVLADDLPDQGLCRGDVGAVVHCYADGAAYEVEFVTGDGATIAVLTLDRSRVRPIGAAEILHVRGITSA